MMYGSKKHDGQLYQLTKIFDSDMEEINLNHYKPTELVKVMSNRKFEGLDETDFNDDLSDEERNKKVEEMLNTYDPSKKQKPKLKPKQIESSDEDVEDEIVDEDDGEYEDEDGGDEESRDVKKDKFKKSIESTKSKRNDELKQNEIEFAKRLWIYYQWIGLLYMIHGLELDGRYM